MATLVFCSPYCTGCEFKDAVAIVRRFCEENGHDFVLRQTDIPVNKKYAEGRGLGKFIDKDFLLCEETNKVKIMLKKRKMTISDLEAVSYTHLTLPTTPYV